MYDTLLKWKDSRDRKPVIIEGIRQCGKTALSENQVIYQISKSLPHIDRQKSMKKSAGAFFS
jgi:predicted AAA+ superfamily ATPase